MNSKLKLHILKDVVHYINIDDIPEHISVEIVETIDSSCMELDMDVY